MSSNGQEKMGAPLLASAGNSKDSSYGTRNIVSQEQAVGGGRFELASPAPARPPMNGAFVENMVCGAGPAGLLTACLLAKEGVVSFCSTSEL